MKQRIILILSFLLLFTNTCLAEHTLFSKVQEYFCEKGFECNVVETGLEDAPLGNLKDWYDLVLNESEIVHLYFDESNRADYITRFLKQDCFTMITRFGLRFLLTYDGDNPELLQVLADIPNSTY